MEKKNPSVLYGEVISKCWEDETFKKHFVEDPESVLAEAGIPVEEGVTYKVIEAPKLVEYVVLPEENIQESIQNLTKRILAKADKGNKILSEDVELRIVQNTEDTRYLVLPASPKTLTKAELQRVFGGGDNYPGDAPLVTSIENNVAVACPITSIEPEVTIHVDVVVTTYIVLI